MPTLRGAWENGQKVHKYIGFDATEDHRTYTDGEGLDVCPDPDLPPFGSRYKNMYPLREWGYNRHDCMKIISDAGLPVPPKSACFFCPAMREEEIQELGREEPDLLRLALEMERRYRAGHHFRGEDYYTVSGKHVQTGEKEKLPVFAGSVAEAREKFRLAHDDTARPYKYTNIRVSQAVPGLGRSFAWGGLELPLI